MPDTQPHLALERRFAARLFAGRIRIEAVERVAVAGAHSGTAFFARAGDGRRYKLRDCRFPWRAAALERWCRTLPDVLPELVAREGRYLLLAALDDHRPVERVELVRGAARLGRIGARVHEAGRARGPGDRALRRVLAAGFRVRFRRDLALLRRREILPAVSCDGVLRKARAHARAFGLPVALELDDLHKGNWMLRDADGDLRYVDEEAVGLRPKGTGMASLMKTATRTHTWKHYRRGYAEIADPSFMTMPYTEYLLLLEAVRRVAHKVRTDARLEKLPAELAGLREMADRPGVALEWCFPKG